MGEFVIQDTVDSYVYRIQTKQLCRTNPSYRMTSNSKNPVESIRNHSTDSLIALFGDPPITDCTNNPDHTIREGTRVSLAILLSNTDHLSEPAEIVGMHCNQCGFPDVNSISRDGAWLGFVTGRAIPVPVEDIPDAGEQLVLKDVSVEQIHRLHNRPQSVSV